METPMHTPLDTPTAPRSLPKRTLLQKCVRGLARVVGFLLLAFGGYLLIVLIGLIPVNNDFEPTPDGMEIFLTSTSIHADIIVPIRTATIDWREQFPARYFSGDTSNATHVAVGWGDKGFYVATPTCDDLTASTVVRALLLPSDSCMHVTLHTAADLGDDARSLKISVKQYEQLVEYINASFRLNADSKKILVDGAAYGSDEAFFEAHGRYHCFNTCNCWTGGAMQSAGIRTGWFTPLPKTMFLYLPE